MSVEIKMLYVLQRELESARIPQLFVLSEGCVCLGGAIKVLKGVLM